MDTIRQRVIGHYLSLMRLNMEHRLENDYSMISSVFFFFFFFQAEDGIRDYKVTGVQTCALPICQLVLGLIAMMAISSPQYVWTLFTGPLNQKLGTTLAELQWTFSLLIILQTWCSPLQAYLVDRFGPRLLITVGALMSGGGWILSSYVNS